MPRSGAGPVTGAPSSSTRPVGRRVEPGHDAQQRRLAAARGAEDGDEIVVRHAELGRLQRHRGRPPRAPGKMRATPSIADGSRTLSTLQGNSRWFSALNSEVRHEADHADHEDAEDHLSGVEQALRVHDDVTDPARGADQLGDDHVGPRPAEHEPQGLGDLRRGGRQHHAPHDAASAARPACTPPRPGRAATPPTMTATMRRAGTPSR